MPTPTSRGPAVVVALLAVLAALIALVLWALRDEDAAPTSQPPAPVAKAPAPPKKPKERPLVTRTEVPVAMDPPVMPVEPARRPVAPTAELRKVVKLHVVVRRSGGGPASGADVSALDPLGEHLKPPGPVVRERKQADGDGKVEFGIAGGTTVLRVLASLDGEAALSDPVDVGSGDERTVELDLRPARSITVRVLQSDGAPAGAASVRLLRYESSETWPLPFTATADQDGVAKFPPLPDIGFDGQNGWLVEASAAAQGRASRWVRASDMRARPDVVIQLAAVAGVRGRCVDAAGAPLVGARVQLSGLQEFTLTGADGRFELLGLAGEGSILVAKAPDLALGVVRDLRGDAGDVDVGDVVLQVGGTIRGTVVGADGQPVPLAVVFAAPDGVKGVLAGGAYTDEKGAFEIAHIGDGPHDVEAQEPQDGGGATWTSIRRATASDVVAGAEIRLVLDGAASVFIRFLNDTDRTPVAVTSVKLTAKATGDTPDEAAWAWSGGGIDSVRFKPDHTGTFDVTVEIPGFDVGVARGVEVSPDRELRIDVLFRKTVR